MTKTDLARAQMIHYEGKDGDALLFSTPSWTRPKSGIVHHLTADFSPGVGVITCTCEDGRMHKRFADILTGEGNPCKHIRACHTLCKHIMEQNYS